MKRITTWIQGQKSERELFPFSYFLPGNIVSTVKHGNSKNTPEASNAQSAENCNISKPQKRLLAELQPTW